MALYKKETDGTTKLLAGGTMRQWVGTQERYEEVKDTIPNNTMIIITDQESDYENDIPIGTILQYKGDTAPNGYLFTDGGTFDENAYPALYNILGSNTLPEKYAEFSNGLTQGWSWSTVSASATAQHDGIAIFNFLKNTSSTPGGPTITINGVQYTYNGTTRQQDYSYAIDVKKGDFIQFTADQGAQGSCYFRYKTVEPYVIKALDAAATADFNTQQTENILNAVQTKAETVETFDGDIYKIRVYNKSLAVVSFIETPAPYAIAANAWTAIYPWPASFLAKYTPTFENTVVAPMISDVPSYGISKAWKEGYQIWSFAAQGANTHRIYTTFTFTVKEN